MSKDEILKEVENAKVNEANMKYAADLYEAYLRQYQGGKNAGQFRFGQDN